MKPHVTCPACDRETYNFDEGCTSCGLGTTIRAPEPHRGGAALLIGLGLSLAIAAGAMLCKGHWIAGGICFAATVGCGFLAWRKPV